MPSTTYAARPGTRPAAAGSRRWRASSKARFALWKNPEDLTGRQKAKLASIATTNERLYRAYLLKEQLRQRFHVPTADALALLEAWLRWARSCRIPAFVALARSAAAHRARIAAALTHRLSNALVELVNTRIRLITRVAFGFHSSDALVARAAQPRRLLSGASREVSVTHGNDTGARIPTTKPRTPGAR